MRILVAHNLSRERTGGASRLMGFSHDLVSARDHEVDFMCAEDVGKFARPPLGRLTFPLAVFKKALAQKRDGKPYDVINVHEPSGAAALLGRRCLGDTAIVVTSYGVEKRGWKRELHDLRLGRRRIPLKTRLLYPSTSLWQSRITLKLADHVLCASFEDREYLITRFSRSARSITVLRPGAEACYAAAARGRNYRRASRLLFPASWIERKGVMDFVPAFENLAARFPDLELVVLDQNRDAVVSAFSPAFQSRISAVATRSERDNAALFASADVCILPSLFEGTPLGLIESMMSGLPIVTTRTCGMRDVIQDGVNGLLIPMRSHAAISEALERLLRDATLREALGMAARREAVAKYTWAQTAETLLAVYEKVSRRETEGRERGFSSNMPQSGAAEVSNFQ